MFLLYSILSSCYTECYHFLADKKFNFSTFLHFIDQTFNQWIKKTILSLFDCGKNDLVLCIPPWCNRKINCTHAACVQTALSVLFSHMSQRKCLPHRDVISDATCMSVFSDFQPLLYSRCNRLSRVTLSTYKTFCSCSLHSATK